MLYEVITNSGGSIDATSSAIMVNNANEVLILISIATNFIDYQTLTNDAVTKCIYRLLNTNSVRRTSWGNGNIKSSQNG